MDNENTPDIDERTNRLTKDLRSEKKSYNPGYSRFIRSMRLILPLIAIAILAVVLTWNNKTYDIQPAPKEEKVKTPIIGKNELLNPRFESKDDKEQPYVITAKRAIQGETNDNLVILEEPTAELFLKDNSIMTAQSEQGAFRQDNKRLLLKQNVVLTHDAGYTVTTEEINVDMKEKNAWNEAPLKGTGPEGTLEASGLHANFSDNILILTGPAKLVLTNHEGMGELFSE